ncbi:hypothetical protein EXIGLDRAFT_607962 [Exidia glandulosa HHB12029]|uniref:Methyltransferase domain-containing protein n=1 Tax=Exidia glandulosa HHB12029 TaxID=1314781 RepID=A0A165L8Z2_EXIGL|nr:hypothetical protein EXIGLDRAFT_607962 [Exidia glandulosa HHB12029]
MSDAATERPAHYNLPIDPSVYSLQPDEAAFFKEQTGLHDDEVLKEHILAVQAEAYQVYPYPCIRVFNFTTLKISRFAIYQDFLQLPTVRRDAVLLDLGCCFGNDARKAVADGFPASQVIASDLRPEFWDLGRKLFRSSTDIRFIPGDVFQDSFLGPDLVQGGTEDTAHALNNAVESASLNPLYGKVSAIHASAFFHLFNEAQQEHIARRLALLLSPEPGSIIFGSHGAALTHGKRTGQSSFDHSPESWTALWQNVFAPRKVIGVMILLRSRKQY